MSVEESVDRPVPPNAELVWAEAKDNKVEGWFFSGSRNVTTPKRMPLVIFFHGNNEVMDHCLEFPEMYQRHGISVLLVEYRGYGRSEGTPSKEAILSDMVKFYDWAVMRPDVDTNKIIFQGRSIGGAVAADLSTQREPSAMIISSTFTSMEVMFWRFGIPGFVADDKYRTEDILRNADFPLLVMHGSRDNIIPVSDGRELGRLGRNTQYIEYDANHDLPVDWSAYETHLINFLNKYSLNEQDRGGNG